MLNHFRAPATLRLAAGLGLALIAAACAPQNTMPQASAPPASQMSMQPSGQAPMGGNMGGMDHSRMGGMGGMNMQQMMAHCAQMRNEMRPGATAAPEMQHMMQHCQEMGGASGMPAR